MPDEPLIPLATPAVIGLTGKLPAHGDFIRRGDIVATGRYDRWLSAALAAAAAQDRDALTMRLDAMPAWRFVTSEDDGVIAGAMIASHDRVGRLYPLVGFAILPAVSRAQAEAWCMQAEAVLIDARDAAHTADALAASLAAIRVDPALDLDPEPDPAPPQRIWWRDRTMIRREGPATTWPTGADFDQLLDDDAAAEPEIATS